MLIDIVLGLSKLRCSLRFLALETNRGPDL